MDYQIAADLSDGLENLETARQNLIAADKENKVVAAEEYMRVRKATSPAFAAAEQATELDSAESPGEAAEIAEEQQAPAEPVETEAAPNVPLVQPPDSPVTPETIEQYGPMLKYEALCATEGEQPQVIEATPYAFAEGTAVDADGGSVGLSQPSRLIRAAPGGQLGVVTQDVFETTYRPVEDAGETSKGVDGVADTGATPAAAGTEATPEPGA